MSLRISLLVFVVLTGCQFAQRRALGLIEDRTQKLKGLSQWQPVSCLIEARLTSPSVEHYKRLLPQEKNLDSGGWTFRWRARETTCEVTTSASGEAARTQKGLMDTALCTLLQVHWVNSPFDELKIEPEQVDLKDNLVRVRAPARPELGLYLPTDRFVVETRTRARGNFQATYAWLENEWLPKRIEVRSEKTVLALDDFEYDQLKIGGRRMIKTVWLELGEDRSLRQAQLIFSECRPD
jgi:hypothetical protein